MAFGIAQPSHHALSNTVYKLHTRQSLLSQGYGRDPHTRPVQLFQIPIEVWCFASSLIHIFNHGMDINHSSDVKRAIIEQLTNKLHTDRHHPQSSNGLRRLSLGSPLNTSHHTQMQALKKTISEPLA
jgi:hypothetical protein